MYVRIGILVRSAGIIYIQIDVVFTYYSDEDTRPVAPSRPWWTVPAATQTSKSGAKFELKKTQRYKRVPIFS